MNKDIAIIGIAGRFPMAADAAELFENLRQGKDCITSVSRQRITDTALPLNRPFRNGGYLDDVDKFDHTFFGISMAEAKTMCPEQRMLLEMVYTAMENAGYSPASFSGTNTAVFVSTAFSGYYQHAVERSPTLITGNAPEFLAAKVGRYFNLKGNASVIDTTCSSSLVAIHTACNEIMLGDAAMAIVAGVNLQLFPFADEPGGLDTESPEGRSKAFSAEADGMSYGEIAAAILIKPLDQAIQDGDNIQAIIKGTAVNYNGNASSSITAPDSRSQADVLLKAWRKAGISATDLSYIEAHGSGTQLGDSLEFEALNLAFGVYAAGKHSCPISTIKSNMGHGRNVSGLAGLFRTILSLKNKVLFPTIHFKEPSPLLDYENSAVYVNREYRKWETNNNKRRYAGVTSLGWSGTNCHIVLEEAPDTISSPATIAGNRVPVKFHIPLSAKTPGILQQHAAALLAYIGKHPAPAIADISHTLTIGRDHYEYRVSHLVATIDELTKALQRDMEMAPPSNKTRAPLLIAIFSDSQYLSHEMVESFKEQAIFRLAWDACEAIVPLQSTVLCDFTFQYALHRLLTANNIMADHLLPLGIGKVLLQVINAEITLAEGLRLAVDYQPEPILHKEERVKSLLEKLTPAGSCTFFDMACRGALNEYFEEYNALHDDIYFTGARNIIEGLNPVVYLAHILYTRHFNSSPIYPWQHDLPGKKIELPTYQFAKNRCWLSDAPREENKNREGTPQHRQILKEPSGILDNKLAEIFASVLEVKELSLHDDFFSLGGDSLKATRVILAINDAFHVALSFEDLFDFPGVALMSAWLQKQLTTVQQIVFVWEVVLQNTHIRPVDDFFELGGHSLLATQMIVLLNKAFNITLNFEDVFRNPSVKELAAYIDSIRDQARNAPVKQEIMPAAPEASYPLTYAQKRMWFLNYFVGSNSAYNNVFSIYLEGELDYSLLDKAFLRVIERHESLRTVFSMEAEEPRQRILNMDVVTFKTTVTAAANSRETDRLLLQEYNHVFDLSVYPLFRSTLVKESDQKHSYILNIHHIISDGWSMGVLLEDFYTFYEELQANKPFTSQPLSIHIKDYAVFQQGQGFQDTLRQQETYWLNQFKETVPVLSLPINYPRPVVQSFEGDAVCFSIEVAQSEALKKIARDANATLYMVLLAIYNILLSKLANSEDIVVGTPVAGRRFDGLQTLIGLFANTIVIRNTPLAELGFAEFLAGVKNKTLGAFNNQDYPYEELVKKLLVQRDTSRNPLFDAMFIWQNNRSVREHFGGIKMSSYPFTTRTARVDLVMEAAETANGLIINFEYCTALFNKETITRFVNAFRLIVSAVIANVHSKIGNIEIITPAEKHLVLQAFNNTHIPFPSGKTIHQLFEERLSGWSTHTAITFEGKAWSYDTLNAQSNRLAAQIISKAVPRESVVGIMLQRTPGMLVSMLAVLKAGCTYLPIDPGFPPGRISHMVEDSELSVILTDDTLPDICSGLPERVRVINIGAGSHPAVKNSPAMAITSSALAYMIYTSGSTGLPKGVMVRHSSVVNFVEAIRSRIGLQAGDAILCLTTISFDIFVLETILPLLTGARIVLAGAEAQRDPLALVQLIREQQVDYLQITPSHLKLLLSGEEGMQVLDNIKVLMVGGEAFPPELLATIKSRYKGKIYNMYGPTETTVWSTVKDLTDTTMVNIGQPIGNTIIRILDANRKLRPIGIAGELCIGGAGIARGYWKRPELTNEKFVSDPYADNELIYRTGDWARWLPEGDIEYLGRIDSQVKIRGFRIEPGEIESCLLQHEQVTRAVVVAIEKAGDKFLAAYYVANGAIAPGALKHFLSDQLPYYMVPSYFVQLDNIPLTPNGKTDRQALPDPHTAIGAEQVIPTGEIEKQLAGIWEEILSLATGVVGIRDDFFISGGHSIIAVRLIHHIQQRFGVHLTLREIFEHPSIEKQARLIESSHTVQATHIVKVTDRGFYPASAAQEGLFYEFLVDKTNLSYNIFSLYKINGPVNIPAIEHTFQALLQKHDSLRTSFSLIDGQVVQSINEQVDSRLELMTAGKYASVKEAFEQFIRPFDLSAAPLVRSALWQHPALGHFLFVDIHHIVCDGISLNHLMNDFRSLYGGDQLSTPGLRYVDYACWQKEQSGQLEKQKAYWLQQLSGDLVPLDLPARKKRENTHAYRVAQHILEIDTVLYAEIKKFTAERNVSAYMFLLSVYYILLSKMSGSQDIIVGTDVSGRSQPALQDIVGTFINVLPLRVQVVNDSPYEELLAAVKKCVLEAFDNQDLQFDQIVSLLQEANAGIRNKIVDVHFSFANYLDQAATDETFAGYVIDDYTMTTHYEFKVQVNEGNEALQVVFIYSIDLYENDAIDLFKTYYYNILTAILEDSSTEIGNIELAGSSSYSNMNAFS